jgi:hypothetical protein
MEKFEYNGLSFEVDNSGRVSIKGKDFYLEGTIDHGELIIHAGEANKYNSSIAMELTELAENATFVEENFEVESIELNTSRDGMGISYRVDWNKLIEHHLLEQLEEPETLVREYLEAIDTLFFRNTKKAEELTIRDYIGRSEAFKQREELARIQIEKDLPGIGNILGINSLSYRLLLIGASRTML